MHNILPSHSPPHTTPLYPSPPSPSPRHETLPLNRIILTPLPTLPPHPRTNRALHPPHSTQARARTQTHNPPPTRLQRPSPNGPHIPNRRNRQASPSNPKGLSPASSPPENLLHPLQRPTRRLSWRTRTQTPHRPGPRYRPQSLDLRRHLTRQNLPGKLQSMPKREEIRRKL